jgi:hypothetical protein
MSTNSTSSTSRQSTTPDPLEQTTATDAAELDGGLDIDSGEESIADREERGAVIHIRNARGEKMNNAGKPVTMSVKGTYSHTYRRLSTGQRDQMLRTRRSSLTGEILDQKDLDLVAGCVFAWDGFKKGGQPIPLSKAAVIQVFQRFPYVYDQIREEMGARENFFEKSSSSSATP